MITHTGRNVALGAALILAGLFAPASANAAMTAHIELTANGETIEGESTTTTMDREDTIEAFRVQDSMSVIIGGPSGQVSSAGITWRQRFDDKSTPLLIKALAEGESIQAVIRFYRPSPDGTGVTEHYFTIEVSMGVLISYRAASATFGSGLQDAPPMIDFTLIYQDIAWTHETSGNQYEFNLAGRE